MTAPTTPSTIPSSLPVLLLTLSPLLRAEVTGLLGRAGDGGVPLQLHVAEARERELAMVMPVVAPRVVLIPFDPGGGRALDEAREMRLVAQLVGRWRVPALVLGLRQDHEAVTEAAIENACRTAGAVGYLPRDRWIADGAGLRARIGAAARVKVLRPLEVAEPTPPVVSPATRLARGVRSPQAGERGLIVVVGASAGGPAALRELLGALPVELPVPVLIVQHLPPAFDAHLATDLSRFTPFGVRVATVGDLLAPGQVLLVPGRQALILADEQVAGLVDAENGGVHGRAIDRTMENVAAEYGGGTIGVILSGMGDDGVRGLAAIKARGGLAYGQDEASCQVYGMPRRAAERGVLDRVGPPAALGAALTSLFAARLLTGAARS